MLTLIYIEEINVDYPPVLGSSTRAMKIYFIELIVETCIIMYVSPCLVMNYMRYYLSSFSFLVHFNFCFLSQPLI
jgi:hypothetical protein